MPRMKSFLCKNIYIIIFRQLVRPFVFMNFALTELTLAAIHAMHSVFSFSCYCCSSGRRKAATVAKVFSSNLTTYINGKKNKLKSLFRNVIAVGSQEQQKYNEYIIHHFHV